MDCHCVIIHFLDLVSQCRLCCVSKSYAGDVAIGDDGHEQESRVGRGLIAESVRSQGFFAKFPQLLLHDDDDDDNNDDEVCFVRAGSPIPGAPKTLLV